MSWYEEFVNQFSPPTVTRPPAVAATKNGPTFWLLAAVLIIFATR